MLFADGSHFFLIGCVGFIIVYRSVSEEIGETIILKVGRFEGGLSVVWAGICTDGCTNCTVVSPRLIYVDVIF